MKRGLDGFDGDVRWHSEFFFSRGMVAYGELLRTALALAVEGRVPELERAWEDRFFAAQYERPLLLCASLRRDALADPRHPLSPFVGDGATGRDVAPSEAVREALSSGATALVSLRDRFVQTNEVTRSVGWRLGLSRFPSGAEVALFDLGCSAALNLVADRVPGLDWGVPLAETHGVSHRVGFDRAPVDLRDPEARLWLRACLWPGQPERERRLEGAIAAAARALEAGELRVEIAQAEDMPSRLDRFAREHPQVALLAFESSFLSYLPPDILAAYTSGMEHWLRAHAKRALWIAFVDARDPDRGPAETRATWVERGADGDRIVSEVLASSDFHPTLINVDAGALKRMQSSSPVR